MKAYDRDKLVELFGNDPGTISAVEREFYDTARDVTPRSPRPTMPRRSRARRTA